MLIQENLTLQQKLEILSDAARYDVACTSSGVDRRGTAGTMGNAAACGICHSFSADGRCVSLLKILMTNTCIYDCKYCINRVSNDTVRTWFEPEEICELTMEFYRRNYIEGLFLSSGILNTPDETMERIFRTLLLLRESHHFWGYIHVKAIPGADPELIQRVGILADRMSINLELPTGEGLRALAPAKTRQKILTPMRQIQKSILRDKEEHRTRKKLNCGKRTEDLTFALPGEEDLTFALPGVDPTGKGELLQDTSDHTGDTTPSAAAPGRSQLPKRTSLPADLSFRDEKDPLSVPRTDDLRVPAPSWLKSRNARFVPAGQSTQMIIGATPENDHQILSVTEALYRQFDLKRVFFSAYVALNEDSRLPDPGTPPPLLREHRLYQADWLLRFYGFSAGELLSEQHPYFNVLLDPKCDWALQHPEMFPVEVHTASYAALLRVPGIGVKSARRIVAARRHGQLDYHSLKKCGVVLKRAGYFITCGGRSDRPLRFDPDYLTQELVAEDKKKRYQLEDLNGCYRQLSLFDDFHLGQTQTGAVI